MTSRFSHTLVLSVLLATGPFAFAGPLLQTAGVQCRPSTAADVAKLDYRDGAASNVADAPGTTAQNATVTCSLPPFPPGHIMTRASIYYFDPDRRWSKCYYYNSFPASSGRPALAASTPTIPHIGVATLLVDSHEWVPHAVRCTVKPGQMIYGIEAEFEPLF